MRFALTLSLLFLSCERDICNPAAIVLLHKDLEMRVEHSLAYNVAIHGGTKRKSAAAGTLCRILPRIVIFRHVFQPFFEPSPAQMARMWWYVR